MEQILQLQEKAVEFVPDLGYGANLQDIAHILVDKALLLRFLQKYRFNFGDAFSGLQIHLRWRVENSIFDYSPVKNDFWFNRGLFRMGNIKSRPTIFIFPAKYDPHVCDATEKLTGSLILCLETLRRWIYSRNSPEIKALAVIDLRNFGISQMDFEVVPIVYDLFKRHYPQIFGQCLVLNYGWIHAGLWSVVRTILTEEARGKLRFIKFQDLNRFMNDEDIPQVFNGKHFEFFECKHCPVISAFGIMDNELAKSGPCLEMFDLIRSQSPTLEFFDCRSNSSIPRSIRSAADLQALFPSAQNRISDVIKYSSNPASRINSATNLAHRTKSTSSLRIYTAHHKSRSSLSLHDSRLKNPSSTYLKFESKSTPKPIPKKSNISRILKLVLKFKPLNRATKVSLVLLTLFAIRLAFSRRRILA